MRNIILYILLVLGMSVSASPFFSDFAFLSFDPERTGDDVDPGFRLYSSFDYSLFYINSRTGADIQSINFASGLAYSHDLFLVNMKWNGVMVRGDFEVEGYDQVFGDGDRTIDADSFTNGFQMDFSMDILHFSLLMMDRHVYYNFHISSPAVFGFYGGGGVLKEPVIPMKADLVKNYTMDTFLNKQRINPFFGWNNSFLDIQIGYMLSEFSFSDDPTEERYVKFDMHNESLYGINARLALTLSCLKFDFSFEQSKYALLIKGRTDTTQFFYAENEVDPDNYLNLIHRRILAEMDLLKSGLFLSGFYESIHIPNDTNNRGYLDMAPLSPVGVLYRRKDFLNNFGFFYQQGGVSIGTKWQSKHVDLGGNLNISYLSVNLAGDYYYMDGIMSFFPVPHWTDTTIHDESNLHESMEFLVIEPVLSLSLKLGAVTFKTSARQLIPLNFEVFFPTEGPIDEEKLFSLDEYGGLRASFEIEYQF